MSNFLAVIEDELWHLIIREFKFLNLRLLILVPMLLRHLNTLRLFINLIVFRFNSMFQFFMNK